MPSTFTPGLRLELPANGEQDNSWGDTVNANMSRLDTGMAWQVIDKQIVSNVQPEVIFAIPGQYGRLMLEWQNFSPTSEASPYLRVSTDNAASFRQASGDYTLQTMTSKGAVVTAGGLTSGYAPLSVDASPFPCFGSLIMQVADSKFFQGQMTAFTQASGLAVTTFGGYVTVSGPMTHLLIGFAGTQVATGQLILSGAMG
jgi:hypothetical protein